MTKNPATIEPYLLTMREWQCAHLFVQNLNNSEIARELKCSPGLVASMLERPGVKAHIAEAAREIAIKHRMTEEWLYAKAKEVIDSPMSTGAEKVAAMRLVSRWRGMEIERIEISERGTIDELERARKRAVTAAVASRNDEAQDTGPTQYHPGTLN